MKSIFCSSSPGRTSAELPGMMREFLHRFAEVRYRLRGRRRKFTDIFRDRFWGEGESVSGPGSSLAATAAVRERLGAIVREFEVRSLLDAPCGDFNWLSHTDLDVERYVGVDIVSQLVHLNRKRHARAGREFLEADIVVDPLPAADLVLCRDCLVHLSFRDARRALRNFRRSGSRLLLATTFPGVRENRDVPTGGWRPINLERPPFSLGPPLRLVDEECREADGAATGKFLGLWALDAAARAQRADGPDMAQADPGPADDRGHGAVSQ